MKTINNPAICFSQYKYCSASHKTVFSIVLVNGKDVRQKSARQTPWSQQTQTTHMQKPPRELVDEIHGLVRLLLKQDLTLGKKKKKSMKFPTTNHSQSGEVPLTSKERFAVIP